MTKAVFFMALPKAAPSTQTEAEYKEKKWCMEPYVGVDNNLTLCLLQSLLQPWALSNPVPESTLKVLTNEKRGSLTVVSFDRSRFKLISRKFSRKLVQAPSCERPKTAPRTLFLLFASNNCFPISVLCRAATHFSHHTLN
jgi:hypothetical protein